jgi:hypothetical protein
MFFLTNLWEEFGKVWGCGLEKPWNAVSSAQWVALVGAQRITMQAAVQRANARLRSQGNKDSVGNRSIDHSCCIVAKNLLAFFQCLEIL